MRSSEAACLANSAVFVCSGASRTDVVSRNPAGDRGRRGQRDQLLVVRVHEPADRAESAEASLVSPPGPVDESPAFRVRNCVRKADPDIHAEPPSSLVHSVKDRQ